MKDTPITEATPLTVVTLSRDGYDIKRAMSKANEPRLNLVRPDEVEDPSAVTCALVWAPEDDAFERFPNVKMVSSIAAGVDSIFACPSLPESATVTRIRDDEQARQMAGFAAWHVIWHHRKMGEFLKAQEEKRWAHSHSTDMPSQVPVGILGFGLMGRQTARALVAMGYPVIVACRSDKDPEPGVEIVVGEDAVEEVAARSRILVNLLPLTEDTRDVLNAELFAKLPEGAALVQIGRGEHMVEEDFLAAIESGQIASATLDVFRQEPLPADHVFWTLPNVLVTPHKASDTTRREVLRQVVENYIALSEGKVPPGAVDRSVGY